MMRALLFGVFVVVVDGCSDIIQESDLPWNELTGQWNWAMDSEDRYTGILRCGQASFKYNDVTSKISMNIRYGKLAHQVYRLKSDHVQGNKYLLMGDFNQSWKNVMIYNYPFLPDSVVTAGSERVPISFTTDRKRRILIAIACLPNGDEAVWAFTRHWKATPTLQNAIKRELELAGVKTAVRLSSCPTSRGRKG